MWTQSRCLHLSSRASMSSQSFPLPVTLPITPRLSPLPWMDGADPGQVIRITMLGFLFASASSMDEDGVVWIRQRRLSAQGFCSDATKQSLGSKEVSEQSSTPATNRHRNSSGMEFDSFGQSVHSFMHSFMHCLPLDSGFDSCG